MPTDCISYQNSGYFSKLIVDYLNQEPEVQSFYHRFPTLENFKLQMEEKAKHFSSGQRMILVAALQKQYVGHDISKETKSNIERLKDSTTFTITTGHQLNLFTGPLYFLYKIVSTINLAKALKAEYPEHDFVPVYWMATEDHDFEEINHFNFKDKKIYWNRESFGPVGRLSTEGLEEVFDVFSKELGPGTHADFLRNLFRKAYIEHQNLAEATRYFANELFRNEGLVIIDGDDSDLKQLFIPYFKKELLEQNSYKHVSETIDQFKEYAAQVTPRDINLFYIEDTLRERIVFENGTYQINNTPRTFSTSEILKEIESHPEKFSPNVILRPLYQEVVLPNVCYIGGGGEIAYWLELKSNFEANSIPFPMLLLRNSVLIAKEKQVQKMDSLELSWKDLFLRQTDLVNLKTAKYSTLTLDFSAQRNVLREQFSNLYEMAKATDKSFMGAVKAQEAKQLKGLDHLEKRLLKAEKKNHANELGRIVEIQEQLFPNQSLQERKINFSELYLECGAAFIKKLLQSLNPLSSNFTIIVLE